MTNQEYVSMLAVCKDLNSEIQRQLLTAMQKHSYKWWLTLDYDELAYHQLFEDALLCDYVEYRMGLRLLFNRMIPAVMLVGENKEDLRNEAIQRFSHIYGVPSSSVA